MTSEKIHWEMIGVGVALICAALTSLGPSRNWDIAIAAIGVLLVLFGMRWPQRLARSAIRAYDANVRRVHREHDAAAAGQLLLSAGEDLSSLPTRQSAEMPGIGFISNIANRGQPEAVMAYKRQHRAATIHAIKAGLDAGAEDRGALQLAQSARSNADLLALEARLFKMALELSPNSP